MLLLRKLLYKFNKYKHTRKVVESFAPMLGWYFDKFIKTYKIDGAEFKIPKELTTRKFRARFATNGYEWREIKMLKKHLSKDSRLLELGAAFGVISCLSNRMLSNKQNHIVVEANDLVIPTLRQNRRANNCEFKIIKGTISKTKEKQKDFYLKNNVIGSSCYRKTNKKVEIKTYSLDKIEKKHDIIFDTILMDIEGSEYEFIKENKEKLKIINMLLIEFHPKFIGENKCVEIQNTLKESGLTLVERINDVEVWKREFNNKN